MNYPKATLTESTVYYATVPKSQSKRQRTPYHPRLQPPPVLSKSDSLLSHLFDDHVVYFSVTRYLKGVCRCLGELKPKK